MDKCEKKKISLIIPAYNVEKYVDRCLQSIEKQTYGIENLEIILVNDASTDHTLEHLKAFETKYPKQVLLIDCEENGKLGAARNIGLNYATGDYITFVDSDDVLDSTMLVKMMQAMDLYDCDEVECGFKEFSDSSQLYAEKDMDFPFYLDFSDVDSRKQFILSSLKTAVWGRLYKRDYIEKLGLRFLEHIFYEDVHFSGITMLTIGSYYRINETLYYYFQNSEGIIHSSYNSDKVKQEVVVMETLLGELYERGLLEDILKMYGQEIGAYFFAKSYVDPLVMMLQADFDMPTIQKEIAYFKEHLLNFFDNIVDNPYLDGCEGVFALGKQLLQD